jgi:ribosomal protein S18 acetylase RimI-like enzyme
VSLADEQPLIFRSVTELGGITDEVVADFFNVMRAHELAVRPDIDDLTLEMVRADLVNPQGDLDYTGLWLRQNQPVIASFIQVDRAARNVGIDAYGLPDVPHEAFLPVFAQGQEYAQEIAGADTEAMTADDVTGVDVHDPDSRIWQIQMFCRDEDERYRQFLTNVGLKHVRNFYRMTVTLDDSHESLSEFPGLELVPAITEEQQRLLQKVSRESFREHWGSTDVERTFDDWKEMRQTSPGFSWERAWLVYVDGQLAGLLNNTDLLIADRTDYVWTIGVLKEFRGRGLAKWLLRKSFYDARQRGLAKVALNVDADNSTGAVRLYEAVGMEPTEVYVAYRGPVLN